MQTTINIVWDRVAKHDPVSRGLELTLKYLDVELDVPFWSQTVSFVFIGVIVVTSIRGFLIQLNKVFHRVASSVSSDTVVLVLAQVMGMYFVSSVLLMRMNLPPEYRVIISRVLEGIEFDFYHRWADNIFFWSSLFSALAIYLTNQATKRPPASKAAV